MRFLIYFLIISFTVGIVSPYGEIYLRDNNKKSCDMDAACDMDSHCSTKTDNLKLPLCPLCPSIYSFSPYLSNASEIFFIPRISLLIIFPFETLRDQGYVASIFRPPTSIL